MKIRKKIFSMATAALCCILGTLSVKADLIWEPIDSFYNEHSSECVYVNRQFTANGPDGKVILYVSPEVPEPVAVWENGYTAVVSFTYEDKDGILWGIYDDYEGMTGWMPMDYMEVVYDSISFREEHAAELVEQSGELEGVASGEEFYFWKYPGSERCSAVTMEDYAPEYYSVYTDERGHSWGCVGYYFGTRDVWVCLDEPTADYAQLTGVDSEDGEAAQKGETDGNPGSEGANGLEPDPSGEEAAESRGAGLQDEDGQEAERIVPKPDNRAMTAAIVMVAAVVAVTAFLLVVLKRKGSETPK